jgi:hypothetical protein
LYGVKAYWRWTQGVDAIDSGTVLLVALMAYRTTLLTAGLRYRSQLALQWWLEVHRHRRRALLY